MAEPKGPTRRYPRHALDERVPVTIQRPHEKGSFWGLIADLSEGGMAATIVGELNQNEVVTVQFTLGTSGSELEIRARVAHRHGYYCGFEFLLLSTAQRDCIKNACAGLTQKRQA